jgi:hypothetical protein
MQFSGGNEHALAVLEEYSLEILWAVVCGIGYAILVSERKRRLSQWKDPICDVFENNALAGPEALDQFPKGVKPPRSLTPILTSTSLFFFGFCRIVFNADVWVALAGAVLSAFYILIVTIQIERDFDASGKLKKTYEALLKSDFSYKYFPLPEDSLGFWGFYPTFFPVLLYVVLRIALPTAERFGVSVEHAEEIIFFVPAAVGVVYYVIQTDLYMGIEAEEECYKEANDALDRRKNRGMEKGKRFFK